MNITVLIVAIFLVFSSVMGYFNNKRNYPEEIPILYIIGCIVGILLFIPAFYFNYP